MDKRSPVNSSSWKSIQASANKTTTCKESEMSMQEELSSVCRLQVRELVDNLLQEVIKLMWGIDSKNHLPSVAHAWRLSGIFVAHAAHMRTVYVAQPEGFVDPDSSRTKTSDPPIPDDAGFHAGALDTRKALLGNTVLGVSSVSWMSKKQDVLQCHRRRLWPSTSTKYRGYCDSQSAIANIMLPVQHSRTKHIHTRYHFIKEQVENGIIELYFVRTEYQLADMFTKALPEDRFQYLVRQIGMRCLTPAELEVLTKESA
ncbi:hypothetical protein Tco_0978039 [Tanacetum coccineum]|uniref:Retrovirus-related Pol polyprotein from transposon TNT 1-94 n=1 Tax=Tanacetum coccineum TaxID=301880 RepID=A0ABQ5EMX4_9ASTR